jgi:hypothetical protein
MTDRSQSKRNARWLLHAVGCLFVLIGVVGANSAALAKQPGARIFATPVNSVGGGEPQLAVNPDDPNNLVYAQFGRGNGGYNEPVDIMYSLDGGRTWKDSGVPSASDPAVGVDRNGTFYWAAVAFPNLQPLTQARYSNDGGATWSAPVTFAPPANVGWDRFWISADSSTGTVYISYHQYQLAGGPAPPATRFVVASHDGGKTWGTPYPYASPDYPTCCGHGWTGVISAAHGVLATAYLAGAAPSHSCPCVVFQTSTDDGKTWDRRVALENVMDVLSDTAPFGKNIGTTLWQPYFAADPSDPGRYAFAILPVASEVSSSYAGNDAGTQISVYVTKDSGATWKHSTLTPPANALINRPWLAYSPNGVLGLFFVTTYADGSEDAWATVSPSGGPHFEPVVRLNEATAPPPNPAQPPGTGIGNDNATVVLNDRTLYAAWADHGPNGFLTSWFGRYDFRGKPGDEEDDGDEGDE